MKIFLLYVVIISPLFFIIVGYPIRQRIVTQTPFITSQRCFVVGNANQFFSCLQTHPRIAGKELLTIIFSFLTIFDLRFPFILIVCSIFHVVLLQKVIELLT